MSPPSTPTRRSFLAALGTGAAVGSAGCTAFGDGPTRSDYPEGIRFDVGWPTARHDDANTAAVPDGDGPTDGTVEWRTDFAVGPSVRSLVADGHLLVADDVLRVLDVEGGAVQWNAPLPEGVSPAVLDGTAYAPVATDGDPALVQYALDDGTENGRIALPAGPTTPPAFSNDRKTAFVAVDGGEVCAVDLSSGAVEWTREVPGEVRVPLAVNLGVVVAATTTGEVHCLTTTGERFWWRNVHARMEGPPVLGDRRVYVGGLERPLRALDRQNGSLVWEADDHVTPFDEAVAFDGRRLFTGGGSVQAVDAATGEVAWSWQPDGGSVRCSPAVVGETLVVSGQARSGHESADLGLITGLDPTGGGLLSGPERWRVELGSYAGHAVAAGAGRVFVRVSSVDGKPRVVAVR